MIVASEPAARVMIITALENLDVYLAVCFNLAKEKPQEQLPTNLDEAILFFHEGAQKSSSEIGQRRLNWFALAAHVKRASNLATAGEDTRAIEDAWISLSEAAPILPTALRDNIIWEDNEKSYFSHIKNANDAKSFVICLIMPKSLRNGKKIRSYCETEGIFCGL